MSTPVLDEKKAGTCGSFLSATREVSQEFVMVNAKSVRMEAIIL
jgi:hypothetical protein